MLLKRESKMKGLLYHLEIIMMIHLIIILNMNTYVSFKYIKIMMKKKNILLPLYLESNNIDIDNDSDSDTS